MDTAPGHPEILRIVAPNPGPMTLAGTNTYVVEVEGRAWAIDPGPAHASHIERVRQAAQQRGGLAGVLLTHSHMDHSAAVPLLGAPLLCGKVSETDESSEASPREGDAEGAPKLPPTTIGSFRIVPTPGHAIDHVCFLLDRVCFCGDLVLGEGSSFVPPHGGSLATYLDSLRRMTEIELELLCPGHGPWVTEPRAKLEEYLEHRLERERKLLVALEAGERSRARLLDAAWDDVPRELRPAAAIVLQAHLDKLEAEGRLPGGLVG